MKLTVDHNNVNVIIRNDDDSDDGGGDGDGYNNTCHIQLIQMLTIM